MDKRKWPKGQTVTDTFYELKVRIIRFISIIGNFEAKRKKHNQFHGYRNTY